MTPQLLENKRFYSTKPFKCLIDWNYNYNFKRVWGTCEVLDVLSVSTWLRTVGGICCPKIPRNFSELLLIGTHHWKYILFKICYIAWFQDFEIFFVSFNQSSNFEKKKFLRHFSHVKFKKKGLSFISSCC